MNQNAGLTRVLIACMLVAVALNILVFAIPFEHNKTFWVSYAFVWVAIVVLVVVNYYLFKVAATGKGALYRTSTVAASLVYLAVAFLASLVFMATSATPLWVVILFHGVLLIVCLLAILGGDSGARLVESSEVRTKADTSIIRTMKTQVDSALAFAPDNSSRQALESLSSKIRFSDPVSNPSVAFIEQHLVDLLSQMNGAVSSGNPDQIVAICAEIEQALDQRNAIVRQTK